ncbi:nucleotidyl transferase AbiEii/AbiGii toxin family protein [Gloeobacter morelensis]|uniref:Nucleotidyl transferase AbiEii/AbiGii toxin family protein n=1 Tax=Gloeobacter morelensis MG652769 TaxID=2781736 RepID=A0ABY3PNC2_9CYAN|nr:nucleotidyl transferase AbiEii/AbiGii toxin family protein [Gloeobacter morelensis]UFP95186.1 nucleotidyl transferase AbiEii/AbiGii toxin family protein [Gloeobacter morelensis MG652769]
MPKPVRNIAASVRQRLLEKSKKTGENFQFVVERYALERALYRLSKSKYAELFILKGGMLISLWTDQPYRSTRDVDVLVFGQSDPEYLVSVFNEICSLDVEKDGLMFLVKDIRNEPIKEEQQYGGTRLNFGAKLGDIRVTVQFDISFGDAVTPTAEWREYPCILPESPTPRLRIYPIETVVAEKFETMVNLANSRMKDYYDIFFLQKLFEFNGAILAEAIRNTFDRRGREIPEELPEGLTATFFADPSKIQQWNALVRKNPSQMPQLALEEVVGALQQFLMPPARAAAQMQELQAIWTPGKGWT